MPSRPRASDPPPLEIRRFTPDEAEWAVRLLESRIAEVKALDSKTIRHDDAKVYATERRIRDTVLEIFRENSPEYRAHCAHDISDRGGVSVAAIRPWTELDSAVDPRAQEEAKDQRAFAAGIPRTITMLESLIERVKERTDSVRSATGKTEAGAAVASREVFIVHGRREGPREAVARLIEKLRLNPIILHEQASEGRTIIEKFEGHSEVGYAVVLLTGDDRGGLAEAEPSTYQLRARQNVIHELGYFLGKLGRRRVCVLYEHGVEIPSDYQGVVYVPLDSEGAWRLHLAKEMKAAGLDIDMNLAI
jgi:predicted nucleotide-binding protein